MYNKYKYHQRILIYLNDKRNEYLEHLKSNESLRKKGNSIIPLGMPDSFTPKDASDSLNISLHKAKETLIELSDLDFINSDNFRYSANENTIKHVDSNYFKHQRNSYIRNTIARDIKDVLIIAVSIVTIFSSLYIVNKEDERYKNHIQELQSELSHIKLEQTKILTTQELILNDSIFSK